MHVTKVPNCLDIPLTFCHLSSLYPPVIAVPEADCPLPYTTLPFTCASCSPLMLGGQLFVFGGETQVGNNFYGFVHPFRLDRETGDWVEYTETAKSERTGHEVRGSSVFIYEAVFIPLVITLYCTIQNVLSQQVICHHSVTSECIVVMIIYRSSR